MLADFKNEISQIKTLLATAKNILIVTSENSDIDSLAASLAIYGSIKNSGKSVQIVNQSDLTVEVSDLIGIGEIKKELDGKNFVISWDYQDGSIEKVSYNIENNRFNLVIQPRAGYEFDITADKIDFRKAGMMADLIFTIGVESLEVLNKLYVQEQEMFSKVDIVNVDNGLNNKNFGKINLVVSPANSLSEVIAELIIELGLKLEQDSATNLLTGIDIVTNNLSLEGLRPETLEIAAWCLKNGGRRVLLKKPIPNGEKKAVIEQALKIDKKENDDKSSQEVPSPDWLQPKIFHGTSTL